MMGIAIGFQVDDRRAWLYNSCKDILEHDLDYTAIRVNNSMKNWRIKENIKVADLLMDPSKKLC